MIVSNGSPGAISLNRRSNSDARKQGDGSHKDHGELHHRTATPESLDLVHYLQKPGHRMASSPSVSLETLPLITVERICEYLNFDSDDRRGLWAFSLTSRCCCAASAPMRFC